MANIDDITESMLNGSWIKHTDSYYYKSETCSSVLLKEQNLIKLIFDKLDRYVKERKFKIGFSKITYEDIYCVLDQFNEFTFNNVENPVFLKFFDEIIDEAYTPEILPSQVNYEGDILDAPEFADLMRIFSDSTDFVNWAIYWNLKKLKDGRDLSKAAIKGLNVLDEIKICDVINRANIFTLNHDCLLENYLGDACADGFDLCAEPISLYNKSNFISDRKFHLYKLHGSINWRTYSKRSSNTSVVCRTELDNIDQFERCDNTDYSPAYTAPSILSGSLVKEYHYSYGIFFDMFHAFHTQLMKTKTLFVSGYGWKDYGINRRIMHWLQYSENTKVILLYDKTDSSPNNFLKFHVESFKPCERVIPIGKYLKDCELKDLQPFI